MSRPNALGKGLGALLPSDENSGGEKSPYLVCPIDLIEPNPFQPRKDMDSEALKDLMGSIKEKGILQPIVVRKTESGKYELIAGERRWRAAQLAGLTDVPVLVRDISEKIDRLELAIIENIQRQNLNPLEEAMAYNRLVKEFDLTQEEVAKRVGKERSTVANTLRIMHLPDFAKEDIANNKLTMGHARVLLSLDDEQTMKLLRDEIISKGMSVRQAENWAKKAKKGKRVVSKVRKVVDQIPESYCNALTNDLGRYLDAKAKINQNGARGKIEIEYYSLDDLERLLSLIVKEE